jgi:uncharacterized protein YodC (DUF2158 family)
MADFSFDSQGRRIDNQGRFVDVHGRLLDDKGQLLSDLDKTVPLAGQPVPGSHGKFVKSTKCPCVGDIVRLVSGGPDMTVVHVKAATKDELESVTCAWFDKPATDSVANMPCRESFPSAALLCCEEPPPVVPPKPVA